METKTIVGMALLIIALTVALSSVVSAEMNESAPEISLVATEVDETVNVSNMSMVATAMQDEILFFPRENDTLFAGPKCRYLIWEGSSMGSEHLITVGLVPNGEEVIPPNAIWVEVREGVSIDGMDAYYTWQPPLGKEGYYSLLVRIDNEVSGTGRGTSSQDHYHSEGSFYLEDPPSPPQEPPANIPLD